MNTDDMRSPANSFMKIDLHAHIGRPAGFGSPAHGFETYCTPEQMIEKYDRDGIEYGCILPASMHFATSSASRITCPLKSSGISFWSSRALCKFTVIVKVGPCPGLVSTTSSPCLFTPNTYVSS